jgi:polar amino acid transport system substrate-binding protein
MLSFRRPAALLCLLSLCPPAWADPAPLRLVSIETAPWASPDTNGEPVGFFPELAHELGRRAGVPIRLSLQPFARIGQELESGSQDCAILATMKEWRGFVHAGEVIHLHEYGAIVRPGLRLREPADLRGKTFSVLRGLALGGTFDSDPMIGREYDTDYQIGLRKLAHHRVDGVAGALQTIEFLADRAGLSGHLGDRLRLGALPLSLQCGKKNLTAERMRVLNDHLRAMISDGSMRRLLAKHGYR